MRSMTGYGQGMAMGEHFQWTVSLRGVNHRFLDIQLRWRDEFNDQEAGLRELLEGELFRGRLEVAVETARLVESSLEVEINGRLATAIREKVAHLVADGTLTGDRFELRDLMRLPGGLQVRAGQVEVGEADRQALLQAAKQALRQLVEARSLEGQKIQSMLRQRLEGLEAIGERCRELRQGATEGHFQALRQKLEELAGSVADEGRLAQEAALLVDRGDVSEELDRLASHVEHFREVLAQEGSLGKRLDFLAQEILRELNTVASKCRDSDITRAVVDGKVLCEQLREQVQNVE